MSKTAEKSDPKLWQKVKTHVQKSDKGGKPGQWSARKAQMAVQEYKHEGGGYKGKKTSDNHLVEWTEEKWGTKSGHKSGETGERYLPEKAREHLSDAEYKRTTAKKRADSRKGKQFSAQPKDIASKTAKDRHHDGPAKRAAPKGEPTKAQLYEQARKRDIPGRSKMSRDQLAKALHAH
ncbi:hypothetical protein GCM10007036_41500 [Alsobacter metallidurans]|uniref:DUF5872 domain-containing protein n=1 Tax=Alsobacter metallidurans TaxID=340221 RepID=A0A917I9U2_9HYPH|nr:hypothetical protein [Alsobacter metallidurans]GGH30719.1 hypothetical protein GCM10007036_41500 [Alsobacter metallidurans]